jgi:tetratricopeptide (TPR) repeat protein
MVDAGKPEEAVPVLEKALEIDPHFARARISLSSALYNQRQFKKAEEQSKLAVEHARDLPPRERYYIEGTHYRRWQETYDRAFQALEKLLEIHPDHIDGRNNLALSLMSFERYDEAIGHYEECLRLGSRFHDSYRSLADCYARIGQFDEGHQVLQDYLKQYPDVWRSHYNLGVYLTRWGKTDEALLAFQKTASLAPGNLRLHGGRWEAFVLMEDWQQASNAANQMTVSSNPALKLNGFRRLAIIQLYRGRSSETLFSLAKAIDAYEEPDQNTAWCHNTTARIRMEQNQPDLALERTQIAQRQAQGKYGEWKGLYLAALAQASLGRWDEAEATAGALKRKAEVLPTEKEKRRYHHLIGKLALMRVETEKAIAELERAESMLPPRGFHLRARHVPIWFSLASAYMEAGDDSKAATWFQRVAESDAEHVWFPIPYVRSFYFLGKIHEDRGDMEKAREYYRRFYEYWKDGDMERDRVEEAKQKSSSL